MKQKSEQKVTFEMALRDINRKTKKTSDGIPRIGNTYHDTPRRVWCWYAKACELQADGVRFLLAPVLVDDVSNAIEIKN